MAKHPETPQVDHGLTARQLELIRAILATKAEHITGVDVFGSRATGRWRPESDLDLVLHGDLSEKDISRLWTLFHESSLPISVDIKRYDLITDIQMRQDMNRICRPLFTAGQLQAPSQGGEG